ALANFEHCGPDAEPVHEDEHGRERTAARRHELISRARSVFRGDLKLVHEGDCKSQVKATCDLRLPTCDPSTSLSVVPSNVEGRLGASDDPGVPETVTSGLGPDAEAVGSLADLDASQQVTIGGIDRVDLAVVASRQPQDAAVRRPAAHVRTPAVWNEPGD